MNRFNLKKYKNILFDLDGTLVDTGEGIINSVYYCIKEKGLREVSLNEAKLFIGPPLIESFMNVFNMDLETAVDCAKVFRIYYSKKGKYECALYPGVRDILKELKENGFSLYVATSKPTIFAKEIMIHFDLVSLFEDIAGSNIDNSLSKKDEIINYLINNHALDKKETIMIGDKANDVVGARKAGIDSIGVLYGYGSFDEIYTVNPQTTIKRIADLINL